MQEESEKWREEGGPTVSVDNMWTIWCFILTLRLV